LKTSHPHIGQLPLDFYYRVRPGTTSLALSVTDSALPCFLLRSISCFRFLGIGFPRLSSGPRKRFCRDAMPAHRIPVRLFPVQHKLARPRLSCANPANAPPPFSENLVSPDGPLSLIALATMRQKAPRTLSLQPSFQASVPAKGAAPRPPPFSGSADGGAPGLPPPENSVTPLY